VENGRIYVASPGLYATSFCLDLETGREIWKSTQSHPVFGIYKFPAVASTPVIQGDRIILREINSHGGNEGQAKNLVYIDKASGKTLARKYAGHVDYRTQLASVASNGEFVVYPFGVHDIYGAPAICQNFNRLICADRDNEKRYWDVNIGDIDALAEPVMTRDKAIAGTMEGYLYALHLKQARGDAAIAWSFQADGAINTEVTVAGGNVYFGSNGGTVYCLKGETGELLWSTSVEGVHRHARKFFSTVLVNGDRLYLGAANSLLYCLDRTSGKVLWKTGLSDWIRSRPAVMEGLVYAATIDGKLHCLAEDGELKFEKQLSTHPVYADLVSSDGKLLVSDSHLWLFCVDKKGKEEWKHSILSAFINKDGERIFTDQLSGGTFYQSKPTAHRGNIFFGNPAGFMFGLDAETGQEKWKYEMGAAISVGPACEDGKVYGGQQGGERFFYCLDAQDGSLIWKQTLPGGWVWGSATVDEGLVYVPTVNGYAVCLDGETGFIIWMYPTAKSVPAEPAIDGDLVYFGSWSRSLYAFDKKTGKIVWKTMGVGLDSGTLIAMDGKIYVPHHDNIFKYVDARTGKILSEGNTNEEEKGNYSNFNASPAFHNDRAIFTARVGIGLVGVPVHSTVYSVDAATGKIHWTFPDGGGLSAPAIANGRVYIGSANSPFFYCLDEMDASIKWIYKLGNRIEESTLCIYRDKVYLLSADGYVHAVE
jgi:outer membrane protein assembly factor BamB